MLTFALLAIGFAEGSLIYLDEKVNDPFVQWITLKVPGTRASELQDIAKTLNKDALKTKYGYTEITTYKNHYLPFYIKNSVDSILMSYGRSFKLDEPLLTNVFDEKNNDFVGQYFTDEQDIGLVLTKDFLKKFGYSETDAFVQLAIDTSKYNSSYASIPVPIPIRAVVKSLPGASQIAFTPYFYQQHIGRDYEIKKGMPFNPLHHNRALNNSQLFYHINTNNEEHINSIVDSIASFFAHAKAYATQQPKIRLQINEHVNTGKNIQLVFNDEMLFEEVTIAHNNLYAFLSKNNKYATLCQRIYAYDLGEARNPVRPDYVSINLKNANKVRALRDFMRTKYELEIDISRVEALENYNLVAFLTQSLGVALLVFSLLSVCLYSSSLLSNHLKKIEMNLGTFKAFGLSNNDLQKIYSYIMLTIIATAMCIAVAISVVLGYGQLFAWILQLSTDVKLEAGQAYFAHRGILLACVLILMVTYFTIRYTIKQSLHQSPGNLIYGREA